MKHRTINERIAIIKRNDLKKAADYLKSRGIENVEELPWGAYYYDSYHNSIVFIDENEQLINYRSIGETTGEKPTKGLVKSSKLTDAVYARTFKRDKDVVFFTESPIDAISLYSLGFSAVSLFSTSNKPTKWDRLRKYLNFRTVVLAFDNDEAGNKYAGEINHKLQFANSLCKDVLQLNMPEEINDLNEFLQKGGLKEHIEDEDNYASLFTQKLKRQFGQCQFVFTEMKNDEIKTHISYTNWLNLLRMVGIRKTKQQDELVFTLEVDGILQRITKEEIVDLFNDFIDYLPFYPIPEVSRYTLLNMFIKGAPTYFSEARLNFLENVPFELNTDTVDEAYIFFSNGFIRVNKATIEFFPHHYFRKHIWLDQINDRDFHMPDDPESREMGMFKVFVYNISGKDPERFKAMISIIGYLLHINFRGKRRAVIITDSAITQSPEGRSGKSLLAKALSKARKLKNLNGKSYDTQNKFRYQDCEFDTHLVVIDDARKNLNFEMFFNDVTEGISVEKKNKQPFLIDAKIIITSNQTINLEGGSAKDRVIEIQLSEYYNKEFSPFDEFGQAFFDDWTEEEWNKFFYFMAQCIQFYLNEGVLDYPNFNLDERKILDQVPEELASFLEQKILVDSELEVVEFDKKEMHQEFLRENESFTRQRGMSQQKVFTRIVNKWCILHPEIKDVDTRKSNGKNYITFTVNRADG